MSSRSDRNRRDSSSRDTRSRRGSYYDSRDRRHHHHYDDNDSVDSGYGGSSATSGSPRSPTKRQYPSKRGSRQQESGVTNTRSRPDADREDVSDSDDSEYDPKSKYYMPVDDDTYKEISFQGSSSTMEDSKKEKSRSKRPGSAHRHRSTSSGESDFNNEKGRSRRGATSSRKQSRPRRPLSPIQSEPSEDWEEATTSRGSRRRRSRSRGGWETSSELSSSDNDEKGRRSRSRAKSRGDRAGAGRDRSTTTTKSKSSRSKRDDSPEYKYEGAPDMEMAWFQQVKERLARGVDMKQVRKVGLDAAAVAAIKVAVGTQVPWKQRIPKTIAVGAAAALTDFMVSKTNIQPKGMVGTVFIRQFAEIILANLIINPTSKKISDKAEKYIPIGSGGGKGRK